MRLDVENCMRELVTFGVAGKVAGGGIPRYAFQQPANEAVRDLLDEFLERRATVSHEDRSPAVQRFREMIGRDEKMLVVFEWIRTAAKSDISVLILGPTGSGKEVVARMIHELSRRGTEEVPGRQLRRASRYAVRVRDCLVTRRGRSPARTIGSPGVSRWRTTARCSSMKSAIWRSSARRSCCARSKNGGSSASAATSPSR